MTDQGGQAAAFDPGRALGTLDAHAVRYVVIGGIAARLLGSPTVTRDLDICYARDRRNLEALADALRELKAELRGAAAGLPLRLDADALSAGDHFTFSTTAGDLDVLGTPSGTDGYEELETNALRLDIDGRSVLVASIDDLIRMKRAAGRPKDRVELEILGALREELEARGSR